MDRVFVDSNIFLYLLDRSQKSKRKICQQKLRELKRVARVVISTQVLNEVYAVAVRKLLIEPLVVRQFLESLLQFEVHLIRPASIDLAISTSILDRLNYWDALMIAVAKEAKCNLLWTEDMSAGAIIQGVRLVNPFEGV